jgi:hypothetical protein
MKTYKNTSADWGDTVGGLTVSDYETQAASFARECPGEGHAALITADDEHIYADGAPVADAETPTLYDSETADPVTAEELGITEAEYRQAIADSMAADTEEGHIRVNGRRVYAND